MDHAVGLHDVRDCDIGHIATLVSQCDFVALVFRHQSATAECWDWVLTAAVVDHAAKSVKQNGPADKRGRARTFVKNALFSGKGKGCEGLFCDFAERIVGWREKL